MAGKPVTEEYAIPLGASVSEDLAAGRAMVIAFTCNAEAIAARTRRAGKTLRQKDIADMFGRRREDGQALAVEAMELGMVVPVDDGFELGSEKVLAAVAAEATRAKDREKKARSGVNALGNQAMAPASSPIFPDEVPIPADKGAGVADSEAKETIEAESGVETPPAERPTRATHSSSSASSSSTTDVQQRIDTIFDIAGDTGPRRVSPQFLRVLLDHWAAAGEDGEGDIRAGFENADGIQGNRRKYIEKVIRQRLANRLREEHSRTAEQAEVSKVVAMASYRRLDGAS